MIGQKLIAALAFLCLQASGTDLDTYTWIGKCAKKAIVAGIPNVIPTFTPYKINKNLTIEGSDFTANFKNIYVDLLPTYKLRAKQLSKDGDPIAIIQFYSYWPRLELKFHQDLILGKKSYKREGSFTLTEVKWFGTVYYKKPTKGRPGGKVTALYLTWTNQNITGIFSKETKPSIKPKDRYTALTNYLNANKEALQKYLQDVLNENWTTQPKRIKALFDWCHKNL